MIYKEGTKFDEQNLNQCVAFAQYLGAGVGFGEIALL